MATTDWTFLNANWGLETSIYVSSPSCLDLHENSGINCTWYDGDTLIREGRVEVWFRSPNIGNATMGIIFRSQDNTALKSCYLAYVTGLTPTWGWTYIDSGGSGNAIDANIGGCTLGANTWYKFRITWCEGRNLQNTLATVLKIESYNGSWSQIGSNTYDTNRRYEGSATNMVGLYATATSGSQCFFDDTSIYQA
jgi:hypothetical protein